MDYMGILKRAWKITWRYKALWILGLFAGAGGSGGGSGGGSRGFSGSTGSGSSSSRTPNLPFDETQVLRWLEANLAVIVIVATVLFLIGLVWWILSVAARGGLVWLANEAAEDRPVRAGNGWGAGFHYWGRTFLIGFLLALPILLVVVVIGAMSAATIVSVIAGASGSRAGGAVAAGGLLGLCGFIGLALVVIVPLAIVIGLLAELALRHAVLEDVRATGAIGMAWHDVRHRFKDVALMWLMMVVVGFVYGLVVGVAALIFLLPVAGLLLARMWIAAGALIFVMILVLMVPGAIYAAFYSTSWTIFFRRLSGREVVAAPVTPAYAGGYPAPAPAGYSPPAAPGGYPPPPAPAYPPPAPPAPPAPESGGYPPPPAPPAPPEGTP